MTPENVLVGSGKLYTAPLATSDPTVTAGVADWTGWTPSGYTEDGVDSSYAPTYKDIDVDEEMAPIKKILVGEKATLSAKLAEATLENLNIAIAESTLTTDGATGIKTLTFGRSTNVDANAIRVGFEGKSPDGTPRIILLRKAVSMSQVSQTYKKADKVLTPVQFEALADSSQADGARLGKVIDYSSVCAAPTMTPPAGSYIGSQAVVLASATAGSTIHYTTDGTTPVIGSPTYTVPIMVTDGETIKAFAHKTAFTDSPVRSALYHIS